MQTHEHASEGPASPAPRLAHERYCAEITEQTRLFRQALAGTDPDVRVPTCPDWTLRELAVHLGGAHRWVHEIVRTRAREEVPAESVPGFAGPAPGPDGTLPGTAALDAWLAEGAGLLTEALHLTGPGEPVWSWSAARQHTGFWARRMAHETVIHRADVCAASGRDYTVAPEVAADCVEEWLEILASPEVRAYDPELRELGERAGETLHLHATDAGGAGGPEAEWLIELGAGGEIRWSRAHAKATVALRGPLTEVLRVFYRRLPPDHESVEVLGDAGLLDFWLRRASFGG
ncbi:maleylpyruvate isomerase family mycothiol-dependent enzyme [Streptomyces sp. JJ36]|uniref:maleylpyruvate isomerase family mycothiol-dependent enzyme n=1 Tax=Streptomyces sp. JJ36 TaxID=2736645 RepID=UPI001F20FF61|nr:maleylpyruvate isomerase family mycothiol-dependent enzyme [Streptomyces sp. JJ36]MCF6524208.1 maleylpyruvate isomerase family mycothiol-dependent enzyme [Streptomyces sp. JJ36]